jgi:hypothetical protein
MAFLSIERSILLGGTFFFIATEVKVIIFGAIGAKNIHGALKRFGKGETAKLQLFRSHRSTYLLMAMSVPWTSMAKSNMSACACIQSRRGHI